MLGKWYARDWKIDVSKRMSSQSIENTLKLKVKTLCLVEKQESVCKRTFSRKTPDFLKLLQSNFSFVFFKRSYNTRWVSWCGAALAPFTSLSKTSYNNVFYFELCVYVVICVWISAGVNRGQRDACVYMWLSVSGWVQVPIETRRRL